MSRRKVIIIGAAGRDFHNFNTRYRGDESVEVVAFTAVQIPGIEGRTYPAELAGPLYPDGIPIYAEEQLPRLINELGADECAFSYSDISYQHVMGVSAIVQAAGASFTLLGPADTQVKSTKPVISVCAVRTGSGKSQTSRKVVETLMAKGLKVVAIRHPMPYGDLSAQKVQRFAELADLEKHDCTIEEMEEYEPHIVRGNVIYAGRRLRSHRPRRRERPGRLRCHRVGRRQQRLLVLQGRPGLSPSSIRTDPAMSCRYYPGEVSLRTADVVDHQQDRLGRSGRNRNRAPQHRQGEPDCQGDRCCVNAATRRSLGGGRPTGAGDRRRADSDSR